MPKLRTDALLSVFDPNQKNRKLNLKSCVFLLTSNLSGVFVVDEYHCQVSINAISQLINGDRSIERSNRLDKKLKNS